MRRPVVVDCSVAASWFLPLEKSPEYELLLNHILSNTIEMIVPDLWWYEIMNVMKSAISRGRIQEEDSRSIFRTDSEKSDRDWRFGSIWNPETRYRQQSVCL